MLVKERKIEILTLTSGKMPFEIWHDKLSKELQYAVTARVTRLSNGNFGDHKP